MMSHQQAHDLGLLDGALCRTLYSSDDENLKKIPHPTKMVPVYIEELGTLIRKRRAEYSTRFLVPLAQFNLIYLFNNLFVYKHKNSAWKAYK